MKEKYLFADEAGCFTFTRAPNISKYFIICTLTTSSLSVGDALHKLRHELLWEGIPDVRDHFHATTDTQAIRDRVYETLMKHPFKVQATICEKAKAQPQVTASKARFYKYPWYYQFKHGLAPRLRDDTEGRLLITAASIGTKKERTTFLTAISDVMAQTVSSLPWAVDFRPSQCDLSCCRLGGHEVRLA